MRYYSDIISLTENSRGVWSLDPSMGCGSGVVDNKLGCYNDCYAAKLARFYGYDFKKTVYRNFKDQDHLFTTVRQIERIDLPFLRMGTMGDPSEDWEHTFKIIRQIRTDHQLKLFNWPRKEIVIITKHWNNIPEKFLHLLGFYNITINTSTSALDDGHLMNNSLEQYHKLKDYCKSILRIVSADFNQENPIGRKLAKIQTQLFQNKDTLDTVLRVNKNNRLLKDGIINVHKSKFLGKVQLLSKYNKKTYIGNCKNCLEMCGVTM